MLLRAALKALMWTVAAMVLGGLSLGALTSPGVAAAAAPLVCESGDALVPAPVAVTASDGAEAPAYLCRGSGPDRPVTMTELIVAAAKVMAGVSLLVLWPLLTWWHYRRASRGKQFVSDGLPAVGRVISARRTNFADRSQTVMELELELTRAGEPARQVKHRQALPEAFHAALQPGLEIPALVDPADPQRFIVLVEHVPLADPRDPAIPRAVDPLRALDLLQGTWLMTADEAAARRARLGAQA